MVRTKSDRLELEDDNSLIKLFKDGRVLISFKKNLSNEQQALLKERLNALIPTKKRWEVRRDSATTKCSFYEKMLLSQDQERERLIKAVSEI